MVQVFIHGTDRSSSVEEGSIAIDRELNGRSASASFTTLAWSPTTGHRVTIYDGTHLTEAVAAGSLVAIPVADTFADYGKFRVGDSLTLGAGTANEETVTVSAVLTGVITVATVANSHAVGETLARRIFGGAILTVTSQELTHNQEYVTYQVECGDYSTILDRKLINESYVNRTPDYILTDILNTVNYTQVLDAFEYVADANIQTAWTDGADGANPTTSSATEKEGSYHGVFPWTNSAGSATWAAAPTAVDISDLVGASSGAPVSGTLALWTKKTSGTVSAITLRVGSDASNYATFTLAVPTTAWSYQRLPFEDAVITGTPVWTAVDYLLLTVTETVTGSLSLDGLRVNAEGSYTFDNVSTTGTALGLFNLSFKAPRDAINRLTRILGWAWWVDDAQDLHAGSLTSGTAAPFPLTETSLNYYGFSAQPDLSQVANRVYVRGTAVSDAQTEEQYGDALKTTFFLKEAPRTTGPYLYDLVVSVDTGSGYAVKTVGIANRDDPTGFEFMLNAEEKYLINGTHAVLAATDKIKAVYSYLFPLVALVQDAASQAALAAIQPGTDGVYEAAIVDSNVKSRAAANTLGLAHLARYANALITVSFATMQDGLAPGQLISITKPTHGVSGTYLIQSVQMQQNSPHTWEYGITCASTLFGMQDLLKMLLERDYGEDENESVYTVATATETIATADSLTVHDLRADKFRWATASPTSDNTIWNLFSWG